MYVILHAFKPLFSHDIKLQFYLFIYIFILFIYFLFLFFFGGRVEKENKCCCLFSKHVLLPIGVKQVV